MTAAKKQTTITLIATVIAIAASVVALGIVPKVSNIMQVDAARDAHAHMEKRIDKNTDRIDVMQERIFRNQTEMLKILGSLK